MPDAQPIPEMNSNVPDPASATAVDAVASNIPRPVLYDYVTVLSIGTDPQQIGKTGKITRDDHDGQPYRVTFEGIDYTPFFTEAQVRLATRVLRHDHFD